MTAHIANHPYIACALFLAIGAVAGWLANMLTVERPQHTPDDDITGIGA